ncbi:uncharacterized protein LOC127279126 [Leptopilina boulardi]|uniref:uncharacterized protein LOC127279126 n=1 Tax=Leptopilina boulardi TaxID=63433 RepID=UPI0021F654D8|nr:uncharacterized protein LOC127279126 [Leptopilina boulardi]
MEGFNVDSLTLSVIPCCVQSPAFFISHGPDGVLKRFSCAFFLEGVVMQGIVSERPDGVLKRFSCAFFLEGVVMEGVVSERPEGVLITSVLTISLQGDFGLLAQKRGCKFLLFLN